ncbi:DUF4405 domain-containing protein [Campylobacter geochelonis]|uniref:DUF4405 domain-containing protein n=1 Tax=Campylobacter geochelonis TaxID=1780362 RepID=UPI000770A84A|nr:DUF4405 domain-containing protein [Campylobacter geochelonis]CZE50082.1 Uncharacterised protein [Campylobacter geochelonis]
MKIKQIYATTPTIATFIIVVITGVLMYFSIKSATIKEVHEILGMAFVVFSLLHIISNLKPFKNYFKGYKFAFIGVVIVVCAVFLFMPQNTQPNPSKQVYKQILSVNLDKVLALYDVEFKELQTSLKSKNIELLTDKNSIANIAKSANSNDRIIINEIIRLSKD